MKLNDRWVLKIFKSVLPVLIYNKRVNTILGINQFNQFSFMKSTVVNILSQESKYFRYRVSGKGFKIIKADRYKSGIKINIELPNILATRDSNLLAI